MTILLVGLGAALGAILRYQLTRIGNHVGVLGGYTTFSTLNSELSQLWFRRRYHIFFGYWLLTYGLGLLVAAAGFYAGL